MMYRNFGGSIIFWGAEKFNMRESISVKPAIFGIFESYLQVKYTTYGGTKLTRPSYKPEFEIMKTFLTHGLISRIYSNLILE